MIENGEIVTGVWKGNWKVKRDKGGEGGEEELSELIVEDSDWVARQMLLSKAVGGDAEPLVVRWR